MKKPEPHVTPNTWEFLRDAMITPTGFREYDARWKYPDEINLPGITALGLGLGYADACNAGIEPVIAVGNDYRDYSLSIKNALMLGLMQRRDHGQGYRPGLSPDGLFQPVPSGCARGGHGHGQPQSQRLDRGQDGL